MPQIPSRFIADDSIKDVDIASDAAIAQSKIANLTNDLASKLGTALPDKRMFIGQSNGQAAAVTIGGDLTPDRSGIFRVQAIKGRNVDTVDPTDGQVMMWIAADNRWRHRDITKTTVGLANVDDTADLSKPVSTLQQAAIDEAVAGVSSPVTVFPVTIADCENTTTNTAVIAVTVPANTWLDGEVIELSAIMEHLQNSGSSITLVQQFKCGGTLLGNSNQVVGSSATVGKRYAKSFFIRIGTDLYHVFGHSTSSYYIVNNFNLAANGFGSDGFTGTGGKTITGVDYTSDISLTFRIAWITADANAYVRTKWAKVIKY
jgi:hypothetical protein